LKLNLGCGNKKIAGALGVDRHRCEGVDVVCDIEKCLPFKMNTVESVYIDNVIEHVLDIPALMRELHRICRNGADITIITPHFSALDSWRDPTHHHHLSLYSFDYFTRKGSRHYTCGGFEIVNRRLSFSGNPLGLLGRLIYSISARAYERHFCFMLRASTLRFELKVTK
jgi:SAM-dependent methyltransferase